MGMIKIKADTGERIEQDGSEHTEVGDEEFKIYKKTEDEQIMDTIMALKDNPIEGDGYRIQYWETPNWFMRSKAIMVEQILNGEPKDDDVLKIIYCPKCRTKIPIMTDIRPVRTRCPKCNEEGVLSNGETPKIQKKD